MKKNLQSQFLRRQYMLSKDFEIYYYSDTELIGVPLHTHDYYEFYFFLEGDISIKIEKNLYPVSSGDVMLIPPHVPHCPIIHSSQTPYRRFVFWISQEYCQYLEALSKDYVFLMKHVQSTEQYIYHFDHISFNSIQSRALRLIDEMNGDHFGKSAQITLNVNDLVLALNRHIHEQLFPQRSLQQQKSLYQNLCAYIEEHLEDDLSLDQLAQTFFVSKYHIAHIFKENLGLSIHQYITKKRLTLCREALIGNASITETYQTFGFGDYSSFYRAFKKEYGVSPKEWQDMHMIQYKKD